MTLGQMSEIFFMLLIPFFFRRLGVKWMILVGMAAWVVRYLLFAFGAAGPSHVDDPVGRYAARRLLRLLLRHRLHVHRQQSANDIRGQAQGLLVFFTQGLGMYFGYMLAFDRFGATVTKYQELTTAIDAARPRKHSALRSRWAECFRSSSRQH